MVDIAKDTQNSKHIKNIQLGLILLSVVVVFFMGFVLKMWLFGK